VNGGEADDVSTEKDVSGGWYDAGDYNKYTSWTAEYIIYMLLMYEENPEAWTDDFEIPESGNGIPDILDEAKFGLDHLLRLQFENGSCIAVVGVGHASPPSAATGPSFWGGPSTSATFACAAAYAYGAKVFEAMEHSDFAQSLRAAAISAWNWGIDNPSEIFRNNDSDFGTSGLAAGQQEVNEYGLFIKKMNAAAHLFALTGDDVYKNFFENNYQNIHLFEWTFAYPFEAVEQDLLLYYTTIGGASEIVKSNIIDKYNQAMNGTDQLQAINNDIDAYMANLKDYTWGSNNIRMRQGSMFYNFISYGINESIHSQMQEVSERYVQYLHGANPLNKCYLSNMSSYGADNSVTEFYHSWFKEGSALWSNTVTSTYGPAPGFLVGGPNPGYDWDGCCPSGCGSTQNNAKCFDLDITPPKNQPKQKSYKDFNNGWPLNSWSVTENSNGYQVQYLRLLSKFVTNSSSKTQNIQLSEGWNLISFNLHPADSSIETLFLGLDVAQIKNQDSFWIKNNEVHLNSLKHLKPTEGYLIKMNEAGTLIVNGLEANTNTFEANFSQNNNNGWQLIGVPFQRSIATSNFFNTNNCEIIKDFEGFWDPESDINSISQLIPGKAYFLKQ
jgi:endoglucanase